MDELGPPIEPPETDCLPPIELLAPIELPAAGEVCAGIADWPATGMVWLAVVPWFAAFAFKG